MLSQTKQSVEKQVAQTESQKRNGNYWLHSISIGQRSCSVVNFELANQKTDYGITARSVYAISVCSGIIMQWKKLNARCRYFVTFTKVICNSISLQIEVDP